jgi:hypothetical protein
MGVSWPAVSGGLCDIEMTAAGHITGSQVQLHLGAPHICFFARDG